MTDHAAACRQRFLDALAELSEKLQIRRSGPVPGDPRLWRQIRSNQLKAAIGEARAKHQTYRHVSRLAGQYDP